MFIGHAFFTVVRIYCVLYKQIPWEHEKQIEKKSRPFQILFVLVILIETLTSINREIDHNTFDWQGAESSPEIGFISRIMDFCLEYKCIPFSHTEGAPISLLSSLTLICIF